MAQSLGARVAAIARREARPPRGTAFHNKDGGPGYYGSSNGNNGQPEFWCADFVKWVWHEAGALNTDSLNAAAASFAGYGRLRRKPRVGDAVLFGYHPELNRADHVAIVVWVHKDGRITTIGGDENGIGQGEAAFSSTSGVYKDGPYSVSGSINPAGSPISGFVSPVEDDMPFTDKEIVKLVKKGVAAELTSDTDTKKAITDLVKKAVAAELNAPIDPNGTTPAKAAQAAVQAQDAINALSAQVADLMTLVKALPTATPAPTGTQAPTGTTTPTRTRKPTGTRTSTKTPSRTRTPAGGGTAPAGGRG